MGHPVQYMDRPLLAYESLMGAPCVCSPWVTHELPNGLEC